MWITTNLHVTSLSIFSFSQSHFIAQAYDDDDFEDDESEVQIFVGRRYVLAGQNPMKEFLLLFKVSKLKTSRLRPLRGFH